VNSLKRLEKNLRQGTNLLTKNKEPNGIFAKGIEMSKNKLMDISQFRNLVIR